MSMQPTPNGKTANPLDDILDTRERLVRAAVEVFREKGYTGTRVQDIARRAGYTSGALYGHFESRSDLLAEAVSSEGRRIVAELTALMQERPADERSAEGIAEILGEFLVGHLDGLDRFMLEAFTLAARDENARERVVSAVVDLQTVLAADARQNIATGQLAPDTDPDALGSIIVMLVLGGVALGTIGIDRPPAVAELLRRSLRGIAEGAVDPTPTGASPD